MSPYAFLSSTPLPYKKREREIKQRKIKAKNINVNKINRKKRHGRRNRRLEKERVKIL